MEICSPPLIWIGGSCYRKNPFIQTSQDDEVMIISSPILPLTKIQSYLFPVACFECKVDNSLGMTNHLNAEWLLIIRRFVWQRFKYFQAYTDSRDQYADDELFADERKDLDEGF